MLLVRRREGHPAGKKYGGWWRWALVSPDGVAPSRMVAVSASVNLPLHHEVQKFSSGTGSPSWLRKKGCKVVVVVVSACVGCVHASCSHDSFCHHKDSCSVVADASCNFESSTCDWSATRRVSHGDGSLDGDLLWHRHRRQISPVGPVWDRSSTDGSVYCFAFLWNKLLLS